MNAVNDSVNGDGRTIAGQMTQSPALWAERGTKIVASVKPCAAVLCGSGFGSLVNLIASKDVLWLFVSLP
jgi:hypothetical protein